MRAAPWMAAAIVLAVLPSVPPGYAKAPPSAFGESFDRSQVRRDRPGDDAPLDGAPTSVTGPRRVKPPRANARRKIQLDGSTGPRDDLETRDDDL